MARKRKTGRKRKYASSTHRMRAHRARKIPTSLDPLLWERYLDTIGLGMTNGLIMADSPHGKGLLDTGGYDLSAIGKIADHSEGR